MSKKDFFELTSFEKMSKKMVAKLEKMLSVGYFEEQNGYHLIVGKSGSEEKGKVAFFFLIDKEDGIISDAKFQAFGTPIFLSFAEIATTFSLNKSLIVLARTSSDLLIKQMSEEKEKFQFPVEFESYISIILEAFKDASSKRGDFPLQFETPLPEIKSEGTQYPNWELLSKKEKIDVIEAVLNEEVRPYVALDEGGVEILDLENNELKIAYKGNCTSCFSSVGSTLSAIQEILREKIDKNLMVVPNLDELKF